MKILIMTALYHIEGREDLIHDTSAIHYLLKYISKENDILVINTYKNERSNIRRYTDIKKIIKYYINDYSFQKDGIKIYIVENQMFTTNRFVLPNNLHIKRHTRRILSQEQFNPDCVICHFPSTATGYIEDICKGIPKFAVLHESDVLLMKYKKGLIENYNKQYQECFCRSKKIYNYFKEKGLKNLSEKIVYSGAPISEQKTRRDRGHGNDYNMLYVGKLIERKRVDQILYSMHELQSQGVNFHLDIVGEGEEKEKFMQLVTELNLVSNVSFCGILNRENVLDKMSKAGIFCMMSKGETFGLVYIEAMSKGCITIGTKGEGIDGIIIDGMNGFLVKDSKELTTLLYKISETYSVDQWEIISNNAVKTGMEFSEEGMSKKYLELFTDALSGKSMV